MIGGAAAPGMLVDSIFQAHRLAREIDSVDPSRPLPFIRERRVWGETDNAHYESVLASSGQSGLIRLQPGRSPTRGASPALVAPRRSPIRHAAMHPGRRSLPDTRLGTRLLSGQVRPGMRRRLGVDGDRAASSNRLVGGVDEGHRPHVVGTRQLQLAEPKHGPKQLAHGAGEGVTEPPLRPSWADPLAGSVGRHHVDHARRAGRRQVLEFEHPVLDEVLVLFRISEDRADRVDGEPPGESGCQLCDRLLAQFGEQVPDMSADDFLQLLDAADRENSTDDLADAVVFGRVIVGVALACLAIDSDVHGASRAAAAQAPCLTRAYVLCGFLSSADGQTPWSSPYRDRNQP